MNRPIARYQFFFHRLFYFLFFYRLNKFIFMTGPDEFFSCSTYTHKYCNVITWDEWIFRLDFERVKRDEKGILGLNVLPRPRVDTGDFETVVPTSGISALTFRPGAYPVPVCLAVLPSAAKGTTVVKIESATINLWTITSSCVCRAGCARLSGARARSLWWQLCTTGDTVWRTCRTLLLRLLLLLLLARLALRLLLLLLMHRRICFFEIHFDVRAQTSRSSWIIPARQQEFIASLIPTRRLSVIIVTMRRPIGYVLWSRASHQLRAPAFSFLFIRDILDIFLFF